MPELANKKVLVVGLGGRGRAACGLLRKHGAFVVGVDGADTPSLRANTAPLKADGVDVRLAATIVPPLEFDLAVVSPAVPPASPLYRDVVARKIPMMGELELAYQLAKCLAIAITGTNGKGTTAELVERILLADHRRVLTAGHRARPVCSIVEQTRELDFLILQTKAQQLELTEFFRPTVAVLLNLAPDHLDRYPTAADHERSLAGIFRNQQPFDWAIVQSAALAELRALKLEVPSKLVTFSASDSSADLYLDRGLILSRVPNWEGPLLDTNQCQLRGPHNAENMMAALAVGHALRVPLEVMVEALKTASPVSHRCELVGEANGVQFVNDSKATNLDAMQQALRTVRTASGGQPNVWLIAGGRGKGLDYHGAGPLLTQRVKGAFLIGEEAENLRAAWSLFTPCTPVGSLLEAVSEAARKASENDVVLLSPACSSFDQFRDYQHRGEAFCQAAKSICGGAISDAPKMHGG
ncbi:MAG: UDP-N-acetylmuramoylalanine-D-glutamate ligase [Verrucomicrobiota bacterium]|jgi:UDP-N-acetylmuramoylalanine--D-glutamate ligase